MNLTAYLSVRKGGKRKAVEDKLQLFFGTNITYGSREVIKVISFKSFLKLLIFILDA